METSGRSAICVANKKPFLFFLADVSKSLSFPFEDSPASCLLYPGMTHSLRFG